MLAVSRIAAQEVERRYTRLARAAGLREPRGGSVAVIQRFGGGCRLHPHLHTAHLDGAYGIDASGEERFFTAPAPSAEEVEEVLGRVSARVGALLRRHDAEADADTDDGESSLAQAYAAATTARGTEKHAPYAAQDDEDDELAGQVVLRTRRKARVDGFDLDAEVAVGAHERERLERLLRYFLRPPFSLEQLSYVPPGWVVLELKRPWHDATTHVSMTPSAFLGRLASLVPRPRRNTTLYYGVLSGRARGRAKLVPKPSGSKRRHENASWAALMKHSFGIDVLGCRRCRGRMRLVAVIHDRKEVRRLLQNLRLWSDPLPVHPARGPPDAPDTFDFP